MRALLLFSVLSLWGTLRAQTEQETAPTIIACENCIELKEKEPFGIKIYPNPCNGSCSLKITGMQKGEEAYILIMDLTGKTVFNYTIKDGEVELILNKTGLELNEGTYLVQLKKNDQIETKRMVVK